jgi:protein SCO1/2
MSKWFWLGLGIGLGVLIVVGAALIRPYTLKGSAIQPPYPAPEIILNDSRGGTFKLSSQQGKPVVLFFGYTRCPDVCPATMADYKKILANLGSKADQVTFVLVTVVPAFDSAATMDAYLANFDPRIVGLVGTEAQLMPVWEEYGVYRETTHHGGNTPEELESHSARIYGIDKQGQMRVTYSNGTPYEDIESDLQYLLRE